MASHVMLALLMVFTVFSQSCSISTQWQFSFLENTGANHFVGRITITDSSDFRFTDPTGLCQKYFTLMSNGEIQTNVDIDREAVVNATHDHSDQIECPVEYRLENNNQQTIVVQITVEDINDQTPRFFGLASPVHQLDVYENVAVGQPLVYLAPDDQDEGPNGTVQFQITSGNELGLFSLDLAIGDDPQSPERILYLAQPLDHENRSSYNLSLTLSDMGSPPLTAVQYIVINVVDVDDQSPVFPASEITFDLPENHPLGSKQPFGNVSAIDSDSDANNIVFYYFDETGIRDNADQYFGVTSVTGELYLLKRLDFEMTQITKEFTFGVIARSPGSLQGSTVTVTVHVKDANDEPPTTLPQTKLVQNITENQGNHPIILIVRDSDISPTDNNISSVQLLLEPDVAHSDPTHQLIIPTSGISRVQFTITQPLDREKTPVILATFILTDSGTPSLTSVINVTINVDDINDNVPQFNQPSSVSISEATGIGKEVLQLFAKDDDNEENGTVHYSIATVNPPEATAWFTLNEVSGVLTLSATPDYDVAANVLIEVTASDMGTPPLSNMTLVNISISPPITFPPRSFQQFNGYDLFQDPTIYMEFRTGSVNGLLLYQTTENGDDFRALQIIDGRIVYSSSTESTSSGTLIQVDKWYSLLINETKHIQVWDSNLQTIELLRTADFQGCEGLQPTTAGSSLSVGGLEDAFTVPPNRISSHDLIGVIRTVIINNKQLDLGCPHLSRGTLKGFFYSSVCPHQCSSDRVSCVQYAVTPECQCKGGFDQTVCKSDSDYGSISVSNGSAMQFSLGYNFFFDTRFHNQQSASAPGHDRSHVLQTVDVSFTPGSTNLSGLIFYSRTDATIQVMEVEQTVRYSIYNTDYTTELLLVSQTEFNFRVGQEYRFTIEITNTTASMYQFNEIDQQQLDSRPTPSLSLFAQTSALLSLGGTEDRKAKFVVGDFKGCINNVELNGVSIPLKGILSSTDRTITGSPRGLGNTCHPCYSGACPTNSTCEIQGSISDNDHQCHCNNPRYTITNGACGPPNRETTPSPTIVGPSGVGPGGGEQLHLGLLAGIAVSALLLIAFVSILLLVICRVGYTYKRRAVAEFTPTQSSNSTPPQPQRQQEKCNGIGKSDSEMVSALRASMHSNDYVTHTLMTSKLPAIQLNNGNLSPCSPSSARSRSVSQETGFQTASELGDSRRNSHREDLPLDSDFSNYDTDSEDFTGTSCIEEAVSPHDMHLVSSGSTMGVPHNFRRKHPLTPKERNALTPLRPNSDLLSETETELSISRQPARQYIDNGSQVSDSTTHKWYKSSSPSTIVDEDANVPHSLQAAALHKQHRSKKKHSIPSHYKHGMSSSPIHHYPYHPQTSSPLVHSQRFNFPAVSPLEPPHLAAITEHMMPSYGYPYHTMHPACHPRQYSEHSYTEAAAPIHIRGISDSAYYPGYQGTSLSSTGHPETPQYRDLNSFAQGVNPITYWEHQTRLRPTVDQEDPLHLLAGPCVPFEDVSTEPSVIESTVVDNHSSIIYMPSAQGAAEHSTRLSASPNKVWTPPIHNGTPTYHMEPYRDIASQQGEDPALDNNIATNLDSTGSTQSQSRPQLTRVNITHFPTAECTPSYNNHSSNTLMSPSGPSGFQVPSSQDPLCV